MNDILQEIKRLQQILERKLNEPQTQSTNYEVLLLVDEIIALSEWFVKIEEEM
jgi:hypothetical protein